MRSTVLSATVLVLVLSSGCVSRERQQRAYAQCDLGRAYIQEGNTEAAIEVLYRAIDLYPRNWIAWNHLGLALMQKQEPEGAEDAFRKAIRFSSGNAEPRLNYGVLLFQQGRVDEAITSYQSALDDLTYRKPAAIYLNLGVALASKGEHEEAVRMLQNALSRASNLCAAWVQLGREQAALGRTDDALGTYERGVVLCGLESPEMHVEAARILLSRGAVAEATNHLQVVIQGLPGSPIAAEASGLLPISPR